VTSIPGELLLAGVLGSMSLRSDEKFKGVKKSGEKTRLRGINDGGVLFGWKKSTRSKTVKKKGGKKRDRNKIINVQSAKERRIVQTDTHNTVETEKHDPRKKIKWWGYV
jgi:hypothetical protein